MKKNATAPGMPMSPLGSQHEFMTFFFLDIWPGNMELGR